MHTLTKVFAMTMTASRFKHIGDVIRVLLTDAYTNAVFHNIFILLTVTVNIPTSGEFMSPPRLKPGASSIAPKRVAASAKLFVSENRKYRHKSLSRPTVRTVNTARL
jgi:hypothetical protein